jgi:hypothetical protein
MQHDGQIELQKHGMTTQADVQKARIMAAQKHQTAVTQSAMNPEPVAVSATEGEK